MKRKPVNLGKGQTQELDRGPADKPRKVYTTERPDGLLVAHESRPVGFGVAVEEWTLDVGNS